MTAKNVVAIYALSPQQQGMLFDTLHSSESGIHIEQKIYVLHGELDVASLERAWQILIERHSILRTAFVWKNRDEPLQCVLQEVDLKMIRHDWRTFSRSEQSDRFQRYLEEDRRRGFELTKPPLMRLALFQLGDREHQLLFTHHHIVLDGWCRPLIDKEVERLYQGDTDLPPVRPYRDYIAWLKRQDLASAEQFWRGVLNGISEPTPLGVETTEIDIDHEAGFGELRIKLPANTAEKLKQLTRQHHVTLSTLVQGVWALMLSRYSGSKDVIFGTTVSGRPMDLEGADAMLGLFINTLPFRVKIPDGSIWNWLSKLQSQHLEMRQYEYCSSGQIHQWSSFPGSRSLYESIIVFENYPGNSDRPPSILSEAQTYNIGAQTRYALNILVVTRDGLELLVVFDRARFVEANVSNLRQHFVALCEAITANPEQDLTTLVQEIPIDEVPRIRVLSGSTRDYEAPRNAREERLAKIWAEVLGVDRIGINDDFFALKGHSLLATQVLSRIRDAFNVQLPLRSLFESPTIAALAERIELAERDREPEGPSLVPVPRDRPLPLSFPQQRLWFLSELDPDSPSYNITNAIRLSGPLNQQALEKALSTIVDRHESLRTVFHAIDDQPVQVVLPPGSFTIETVDVRDVAATDREATAMSLIADASARPFQLANEKPFRALLLKLGDQEYILFLNVHHIVSDGWSMAILFRELGLLYDDHLAQLPELKIQYPDYAVWQRDWLQGERLEELLAYWRRHLAGAPMVLELPLDRPRPAVQGSAGEKVRFSLAPELSHALQSSSRREGVTAFMTLLAAFQVLLGRYAGRDDVVVGTDLANRMRVETEGLIGFFVNLLPVRTKLTGNPTFSELLHQVREVLLEVHARQELPFEKLVEEIKPPRDLSRNPLVQVLFVMQNTPRPELELTGLKVDWMEAGTETSRFDLVLFVAESGDRIKGTWVYNADLFERATIERMSAQFERVLGEVVKDPSVNIDKLSMKRPADKPQQPRRGARRKAVDLAQLSQVKSGMLSDDHSLPLVIEPEREDVDLAEWAAANSEFVQSHLLRHGALLFRGFDVPAVPDFERFAQALCPALYGEYGDLPREEMGGKVYGSTPYPEDETILFHNESSHMHRWPMLIWFYCVKAAERGGETPIVDCRKIYQALDPGLRQKFADMGLMYVRNFTPGLDVSWQHFFGTDERSNVENYCKQASIDFEWTSDGGLRTRQICPAIVKHPQTGEMVFFNQLQLHHVSCLAAPVRESLLSMMREEDLPRNVYFGDGTRIDDSVVDGLLALYRESAVAFPWQQHDIIMLNNMLVAHSRNPYIGERKIVVALGNVVTNE